MTRVKERQRQRAEQLDLQKNQPAQVSQAVLDVSEEPLSYSLIQGAGEMIDFVH